MAQPASKPSADEGSVGLDQIRRVGWESCDRTHVRIPTRSCPIFRVRQIHKSHRCGRRCRPPGGGGSGSRGLSLAKFVQFSPECLEGDSVAVFLPRWRRCFIVLVLMFPKTVQYIQICRCGGFECRFGRIQFSIQICRRCLVTISDAQFGVFQSSLQKEGEGGVEGREEQRTVLRVSETTIQAVSPKR